MKKFNKKQYLTDGQLAYLMLFQTLELQKSICF